MLCYLFLKQQDSAVRNGASTDEPHDYVEDQTKHAILDHEQSFPYALNNASQDVPLGTPRIEPRIRILKNNVNIFCLLCHIF